MTRLVLARALGVLLGVFGFALLWNGIVELRYASGIGGYAVVVLDILGGPIGLLGGYWLWHRDRRALVTAAVALALGILAGTTAAWTYMPGPERGSATFGALAAGLVFGVAVVLLAHLALKPASQQVAPQPHEEQELSTLENVEESVTSRSSDQNSEV